MFQLDCYVDLPGCRPNHHSSVPVLKRTTNGTTTIDRIAAKRIIGFHTTQRGTFHYREHSKCHLKPSEENLTLAEE